MIRCEERLEVTAIPGVPLIGRGDDLPAVVTSSFARAGIALREGDVVVVTSKVVSRAEGRMIDVSRVEPSARAIELAAVVGKEPSIVELILRESTHVSRAAPGVLIVRHRLGFVVANAGIDFSNSVAPEANAGPGPWALLLPESPDASAAAIRSALEVAAGVRVGVVISDSFGRPFRFGSVGAAIGVAGLPPLWDRRGDVDLFGRPLEITVTALGDQVAAAADLVAGQANEGRAIVMVRGLGFTPTDESARDLCRRPDEDLYA